MQSKYSSENLTGRDHAEGVGVDAKVILKWIGRKQGGKMWIGFIWLRRGISGSLL